jgi:cyclopropane fatty-acyl-phospholipid synthase-like methyltransferase
MTRMEIGSVNPYDRILYPSQPHAQTHPDRLATIATLFGMTAKPVEHCRLLELGCGDGSNLGPIAYGLPDSSFLGIDVARNPVLQAQKMAADLKLKNLTFRQLDINSVSEDLGKFDYIIAHGVYSWVPEKVRCNLLRVCRFNLAPNGVAFVSYTTYPGSYLSQMVREMVLYHVHKTEQPEQQVSQAIAMAKFLAESQADTSEYTQMLKKELEWFSHTSPNYLFHDTLSEISTPVYFHQFVSHASRHGLQYLGEADFHEMLDCKYKPGVALTLSQLAHGRIEHEQYMDFLKCRRFRQTLLCHDHVKLDMVIKPELASQFFVVSEAKPVSDNPSLFSQTPEKFEAKNGASITTVLPLAKTGFALLAELWPQPLHFAEWVSQVRKRVEKANGVLGTLEQDTLELGKTVLHGYAIGLLELHTYARKVT